MAVTRCLCNMSYVKDFNIWQNIYDTLDYSPPAVGAPVTVGEEHYPPWGASQPGYQQLSIVNQLKQRPPSPHYYPRLPPTLSPHRQQVAHPPDIIHSGIYLPVRCPLSRGCTEVLSQRVQGPGDSPPWVSHASCLGPPAPGARLWPSYYLCMARWMLSMPIISSGNLSYSFVSPRQRLRGNFDYHTLCLLEHCLLGKQTKGFYCINKKCIWYNLW